MKFPVTPNPSSRAMRTASTVLLMSASLFSELRPGLVWDSKPKKISKVLASGRHSFSRSAFSVTRSARVCTSSRFLRSLDWSKVWPSSSLRMRSAQNKSSTMNRLRPVASKSART